MKERGLTFCQDLVPKILDGSKFVTRRLGGLKEINEDPGSWHSTGFWAGCWHFVKIRNTRILNKPNERRIKCRQGVAGDRFYMQEAWGLLYPDCHVFNHCAAVYDAWNTAVEQTADFPHPVTPLIRIYKTDHLTGNDGPGKVRWRSGRFQPKWACRPQRWELISIRPERLHQMTVEDVRAEGFENIHEFVSGWNALNAKRGYGIKRWWDFDANDPGWDVDPDWWVWREEWNPKAVKE